MQIGMREIGGEFAAVAAQGRVEVTTDVIAVASPSMPIGMLAFERR